MKEVPFIGGAYAGESPDGNAQDAINLVIEADQEGGRTCMLGAPGLEEFVDLS